MKFPGLALDRRGKPVPVLSSDEAFNLFYGRPDREHLMRSVTRMFQPFPIGLKTPVGLVVANPAYSEKKREQTLFGRDRYHGTVIWSWPQVMFKKGLEQQLARFAGDAEVEKVLKHALSDLDEVRGRLGSMNASELWSWKSDGHKIVPQAFGVSKNDKTEANALQLWSNTD
jgi:hypothetical protein